MKVTDYPNGLPGAFFRGTYVQPNIAGKSNVFWVDSNNPLGNGNGSPANPFTRISYALPFCADNNGDIIFCAPGHHEDVQDAFSINVDGLSIIGLGVGTARPQFSVSGASTLAKYVLAGDNMYFNNLVVVGDVPSLATVVSVTGANNVIDGCHIGQEGYAPLRGISVSGNGTKVIDSTINLTTDTQGVPVTPLGGIYLGAVVSSITLAGNKIRGIYSNAGILGFGASVVSGLTVYDNMVHNSNTSSSTSISLVTGTTGEVFNNTLFGKNAWTTGGSVYCSNNLQATAAATGSAQSPAAA